MSVNKIPVRNPVVEMDGDDVTRSVWRMAKEKLISPYVEIPIEYYDLALQSRIASMDQVTVDAAAAIKKHGVGVKCSTMEISAKLVEDMSLSKMWKSNKVKDRARALRAASPTLRSMMFGASFREPIRLKNIPQIVSNWRKPIVVARHVYADQYRATDVNVQAGSKMELVITPEGAEAKPYNVTTFKGSGVALAMYNEDSKITGFAHACFRHALDTKFPLYLCTKETVLPDYDGAFGRIFQEVYESSYRADFDKAGIWYSHEPVDRMVGFALQSEGGFVLARQ